MELVLAAAALLATIVGTVVSVLQYQLSRHLAGVRLNATMRQAGQVHSPGSQSSQLAAEQRRPYQPPGVVRAAVAWLVGESVIVTFVMFWLFHTMLSHLHEFAELNVKEISDRAVLGPAAVMAVGGGLIMVSLAVRWGARLYSGDAEIRVKLLSMRAIDIFGGVVLVVILLMALSIPEPVAVALVAYMALCIVSGIISIKLLTHPDTRDWVFRRQQPGHNYHGPPS